jgi:hypothetical protein
MIASPTISHKMIDKQRQGSNLDVPPGGRAARTHTHGKNTGNFGQHPRYTKEAQGKNLEPHVRLKENLPTR